MFSIYLKQNFFNIKVILLIQKQKKTLNILDFFYVHR